MINNILNNRVPIFIKIVAPLVILIIITVGLSGYYVYWDSSERAGIDLDKRLERASSVVADAVSHETLSQLKMSTDADSLAYAEVRHLLDQVRATADLDWIGIYYRDGAQLYRWVDIDSTGVGRLFPQGTPEHMAVYRDQQPRRVQYVGENGSLYGFVTPILEGDVDGAVVIGLVEASVLEESRYLIEMDTLWRVFPGVVGGIIIAIGISVFITFFLFSRPLRQLRQGALMLASGHLGYVIDLHSRDELGDLAAAFNQMSLQTAQLYRERVEIERLQRQWEVDRLQESGRLLEAKVAERTSALARRNEELMRSQADLADARDQALEASRAKSVFLANMSHELRTPLNAIIGYSEMLLEDVNDLAYAQLTSDLDRISTAGHHLLDLINDILDLSKIEAGRMDLYLEAFDVAALIDSVMSTVQPLVEKNDNAMEVDYPSDLGSMVADLTKVRQVLFNLLSNASKFTEQGVITLTVDHALPPSTMSALRSPEEWVRFQVKDTGIGVKPEQLDQIFDAFAQGDASTTRQYGGTGLGLAISSRYCHMMGGDIAVESEPGQGSTFTVYLPVTVTDPAAESAEMGVGLYQWKDRG